MIAALLTLIALAAFASTAQGDAGVEPEPPDYLLEVVPGLPIVLNLEGLPAETDSVRFEVDGVLIQTDEFEPYGDYISTRNLPQRGISFGDVHNFSVSAVSFFESPQVVKEYPLRLFPLPVIPRVHVLPLVLEKRTSLVGFQLRGIGQWTRVMAWGRGFRRTSAREPLPLKLVRIGGSSRTYVIPGGLDWSRSSRPRITFSISPPEKAHRNGVATRGRILTWRLKTKRNGDTGIKHVDRWDRCSNELSSDRRPPHRASCVYF